MAANLENSSQLGQKRRDICTKILLVIFGVSIGAIASIAVLSLSSSIWNRADQNINGSLPEIDAGERSGSTETDVIIEPVDSPFYAYDASSDASKRETPKTDVCNTPECQETAKIFKASMDLSADPCDDFYQYVCGKWSKSHPIPRHASKWTQYSITEEKIRNSVKDYLKQPISSTDSLGIKLSKRFFQSCSDVNQLDKVGLTPVLKMLQGYGGWPVLEIEEAWSPRNFDWMKSLADLKRFFSTSVLLSIDTNPNPLGKHFNTVHLQQAPLFLHRHYLLQPLKYSHQIKAYETLIINLASELLKTKLNSSLLSFSIVRELQSSARDIVNFETKLANITRDPVTAYYGLRTEGATLRIGSLQNIFNNLSIPESPMNINVKKLLEYLFITTPGVVVSSNEIISISDAHYLGELFYLLQTTEMKTLANYLHFRMVAWIASGTTSKMRNYVEVYFARIYGSEKPIERENTCAASALEKFPRTMSLWYLSDHFPTYYKSEVKQMLREVKSAAHSVISSSRKLNSDIKTTAKRRLSSIRECISHPQSLEWILALPENTRNSMLLNDMITTDNFDDLLNIDPNILSELGGRKTDKESYLTLLFNIRRWIHDSKSKNLREPFRYKCTWKSFTGQVGAFFNVKQNAIHLPAGIITQPFYSPNRPEAINYGGIGTIMGHELSHGFTNIAGWTEDKSGSFTDISKCFINQYDEYSVEELNDKAHVNGTLTFDENFSDNAGVAFAYKAFQIFARQNERPTESRLPGLSQFDSNQLFFISYASNWCGTQRPRSIEEQLLTDRHSPSKYRVIGTLKNFPEFSEAWKCPAGSNMRSKTSERCTAL